MLIIDHLRNIFDVESKYAALKSSATPEYKRPFELRLAKGISPDAFGTYSSLFQFIISWSKRYRNSKLVLVSDSAALSADKLSSLAKVEHIAVAALMAKHVCIKRPDGEDVTERIVNQVTEILSTCGGVSTSENGALVFFPDSHPLLFNKAFYRFLENKPVLRADVDLVNSIKNIVDEALGHDSTLRIGDGLDLIFESIAEIVKNTDEWATKDASNGEDILPSVRGLYIRYLQNNRIHGLMENYDAHILKYYRGIFSDMSKRLAGMIEISVFDSGSGLAQTWYSQFKSIRPTQFDELEAVKKCFSKHNTSSSSTTKGIGLDKVLNILPKMKCFMRLRSGTLNGYQNFLEPIPSADSLLVLHDWNTDSLIMTENPRAEGALFTLIFPVYK